MAGFGFVVREVVEEKLLFERTFSTRTAYPNIAKSTQHHKLLAKILNSGTACYVLLR